MPTAIQVAKNIVPREQAHTELAQMAYDAMKADGVVVSHSATRAGKGRVLLLLLYTVEMP